MTDLSQTIAAKSDQLGADDLLGGRTLTIRVTAVRGCEEKEQPIAIHYDGDEGKPYKPCLSMRRVLVQVWGPEGRDYVGRSLTLYRDPSVMFGKLQVGGLRISHMSHIDREAVVVLAVKRGTKAAFTVKPLRDERLPDLKKPPYAAPEPQALSTGVDLEAATEDQQVAWCETFRAVAMRNKTPESLMAYWAENFELNIKRLQPALQERLETWMTARMKKLREASVIRD
jgi:hypothetical protein